MPKDNDYQAKKSTLLEETLAQTKRTQEEQDARERAASLGLSYVNLSGFPINRDILRILSKSEAEKYRAIPYLRVGDTIRVATTDPKSEGLVALLSRLKKRHKLSFLPVLSSPTSISYGLSLFKGLKKIHPKAPKGTVKISKKKYLGEIRDIKKIQEHLKSSSTTQALDIIMAGAVGMRASDIHIVPEKDMAEIRFRIDGVLHAISKISKGTYAKLSSRIKYLAHMEMSKQNIPQDGRFTTEVGERIFDIRASTIPTIHGDSIVTRLLEEEKKLIDLLSLGFPEEALAAINGAIRKPSGIILNTGPTGSGKTTTLYAILNKLNTPDKKIVTLEDPVEYRIKGIEQTQVDARHDFDFAKALKSALRQDPDIIMVGEIRDFETASIGLHSALTGHLILSTLHTNNAPAALVRLLDMKIRPFLLVGSINLVIAQRLVRLICPKCKKTYKPNKNEEKILRVYLKKMKKKRKPKIYSGKGCKACNNTGYSGRTAIIEFLVPDAKIEKLITEEATKTEMEKAAVKLGMKTMREDGLDKVFAGITSIREVLEVTQEY